MREILRTVSTPPPPRGGRGKKRHHTINTYSSSEQAYFGEEKTKGYITRTRYMVHTIPSIAAFRGFFVINSC